MTLMIGTVIGGRYEIIEKIGIGGMAAVYRANDLKLERSVTLKVLKEELSDDVDFKDRFKIEARAAAKLSHPNIVNVYDVGEENGIYYIVMEYIHGDTLKQLILDHAPFDNVTTLSVAVQIASALSHAHKNEVIHRDIKPHNILVGVDGTIKVTDFGIARAAAVSTSTTTSNALGSVYYLSPEQARGGYVDDKSDIYSLGITMYEMLSGKVPYDGDTPVAVALKHINANLPDIKECNPEANHILESIVKKATNKRKDERYGSASLLLEDLKQALAEVSKTYKKGEQAVDNKDTATDPILMGDGENVINVETDEPKNSKFENVIVESEKLNEQSAQKDGIELPESVVGFDMYNKKFKISKNDDDFEPEVYSDMKTSRRKNESKSKKKRQVDGAYNDEYKAKEKKVTIAAVVTAGIIIAIITLYGAKMLTGGSVGRQVAVNSMPYIVGITVDEAQEELKGMEVTINVVSQEQSSYDEGVIISQAIPQGTSISKGDVINVVISGGAKAFTMPDVVYDTEAEAVLKIENLGGKVIVKYSFDDTVPVGIVMEQTPKAQTEISDTGSSIIIIVSEGAETPTLTVPDFLGMKIGDAQKLMAERGLLMGTITEKNNTAGEKDTILSQSLTANQEVEKDTKIDFVVVGSEIGEPISQPEQTDDTQTNDTQTDNVPTDNTQNPNIPVADSGKKTFSVSAPANYTDSENISVKVIQITNGNSVEVVYNEAKTIDNFPFSVTVGGSGQSEVQLYIDNVYQWSQNVNFSEGGN